MISGRLTTKRGIYYTVLELKGENGKRKSKWETTGLPVKGNKKKAEEILLERRKAYEDQQGGTMRKLNVLMPFAKVMSIWFYDIAKMRLSPSTVSTYKTYINRIVRYFDADGVEKNISVFGITTELLQRFIDSERNCNITPASIKHECTLIQGAFRYMVENHIISNDPAANIITPRVSNHTPKYYTDKEARDLIIKIKGNELEGIICLTLTYGLRRSEVLGLRWDAIDFENNSLIIRHTATVSKENGKHGVELKDKTKTDSSLRTLPLNPRVTKMLNEVKAKKEENKRIAGNSYNEEYEDYVFVDRLGNLFNPDDVSRKFGIFLKQHELKHIRFHDLRHSCASIMLNHGIDPKCIQEVLGHSDIRTTLNIYGHIYVGKKGEAIDTVLTALGYEVAEETK